MNSGLEMLSFPQIALADPLIELPLPRHKGLSAAIRELRLKRRISDGRFDAIFPVPIQKLSGIHWTPVRVARRAAELLVAGEKIRILDVGSGAGKFCMVGALTTGGSFVGIEQRKYLVQLSHKLAARYKITCASFIHGNLNDVDWSGFGGIYLYNPFVENIYYAPLRIDNSLEQSRALYEKYIRVVQRKLNEAAPGMRVVTFHGIGGGLPPGYSCIRSEHIASARLELWVKQA